MSTIFCRECDVRRVVPLTLWKGKRIFLECSEGILIKIYTSIRYILDTEHRLQVNEKKRYGSEGVGKEQIDKVTGKSRYIW